VIETSLRAAQRRVSSQQEEHVVDFAHLSCTRADEPKFRRRATTDFETADEVALPNVTFEDEAIEAIVVTKSDDGPLRRKMESKMSRLNDTRTSNAASRCLGELDRATSLLASHSLNPSFTWLC
jgi:hypothetical protein